SHAGAVGLPVEQRRTHLLVARHAPTCVFRHIEDRSGAPHSRVSRIWIGDESVIVRVDVEIGGAQRFSHSTPSLSPCAIVPQLQPGRQAYHKLEMVWAARPLTTVRLCFEDTS